MSFSYDFYQPLDKHFRLDKFLDDLSLSLVVLGETSNFVILVDSDKYNLKHILFDSSENMNVDDCFSLFFNFLFPIISALQISLKEVSLKNEN